MHLGFRQKRFSAPGKSGDVSARRNRRQQTEFRLSWFLGLLAFSTYLLTLCPGVFPGSSATSTAAVLKLIPPATIAHPVWQLVCRGVAHLPVFDLTLRLNLFSALCGALAVATLFRLTSRLLFEFSHADSAMAYLSSYNYGREEEPERAGSTQRENTQEDDGDYHAAILGGVVTALAFAFGAAFWSASVSLHPQTFDMLLLFVAINALADYLFRGKIQHCVLTVFCLGLGLLECSAFLVLAPVALILTFREAGRNGHLSEAFTFLFLISGLLGIACGIGALLSLSESQSFGFRQIMSLLMWIPRTYKAEFLEGLPHMGWLLILLETILPLLAVFWGAPKFFRSYETLERWLWCMLNALFTLVAAACLLGLPQTPWHLARQTFHLPVFAGLASALTLGILFTYWRLSLTLPQQVYDGDEYYLPPSRPQGVFFSCMSAVIAAAVVLAPLRTHREADGRKAAFMDEFACQLLACTGQALCLVTDGKLDMHVLIHARLQQRQLTVLPETDDAVPSAPPRTGKHSKPQKKETPSLFVERWLRENPKACDQVAVAAPPALLLRAGLRPVPHGLVYIGAPASENLDGASLFGQHEDLWPKLQILAPSDAYRMPALERLASDLRRQASRLANDLGSLLEDQGRASEACHAYAKAVEFDTLNLCAVFNRYGLALRDPSGQPAVIAECEKQIRLAAKRTEHGFLFTQCAAQYGTLRRQPGSVIERLHATATPPLVVKWIAFNQSQPPADGKPLQYESMPDDGSMGGDTLGQIVQAIRTGKTAGLEARLKTYLLKHPENLSGWSMLADVLMRDKRFDEIDSTVLPPMRIAAGENGHELIDMLEGLMALSRSPSRPTEARTFFLRALARRPRLREAQDCLLKADRLLGNVVFVEEDVGVVLKADPDHCEANALLGSIRMSQKRYADASKALRKSIATLPTAEALNDYSEALRIDSQFDEAEKAARHALRIAPNLYQAWDSLGCVLSEQNRLKEADAAFRCAIALCQNDPRIRLHLARLSLRMDHKDAARQILKEVSPMVKSADETLSQDYALLSKELDSGSATP